MTMMTDLDRHWMNRRDELTNGEREAIEDVFNSLYDAEKRGDLSAAKNDQAAILEAALVRFLIESRRA